EHILVCDPQARLSLEAEAVACRTESPVGSHTRMESILATPASVAAAEPVSALESEALAVLQYTGGTTGISKGAMLTHRNIIANLLQFEAWNAPVMAQIPDGDQHTTVCALPMYHIFAFTIVLMLSLHLGGRIIIIPNARDLDDMLRRLEGKRFHELPGVNTMYNALLNHPRFSRVDWR